MGVLESIAKLDLSDEEKEALRKEYREEVQPLRTNSKRNEVDAEIALLSDAGFETAPGALAFFRQVMLSDDGEPGLVLLSDDELNLSGDDATGTKKREGISTADTLRKFVSLLPRTQEGKLDLGAQVNLSDDHGKPEEGDPSDEDKRDERRNSLGRATGRAIKPVSRSRYGGVTAGGES